MKTSLLALAGFQTTFGDFGHLKNKKVVCFYYVRNKAMLVLVSIFSGNAFFPEKKTPGGRAGGLAKGGGITKIGFYMSKILTCRLATCKPELKGFVKQLCFMGPRPLGPIGPIFFY